MPRSLMSALAQRSLEPELMDGIGLQDAALHARCLADLATVNRVTLAHRPVLRFLTQAWAQRPAGEAVSVLDVGCGHGDLLRAIRRLAEAQQRPARLQGIDLHPHSTAAARAATPPAMAIDYVTADVFAWQPERTDFIVSSQVAHHLDDAQLRALLQWLMRHARHGWCVADLRRHWFPYLGFRWLARLAGWHRVVRLDGTLSIARSLTPADWRRLLADAGLEAQGAQPVQIVRYVPFRLAVQWLGAAALRRAA